MFRLGGSIRNRLLASTLGVFIVFVLALYLVATLIVRQKMQASLTEKAEQAVITFNTVLDQMIAEVEVQAQVLSLDNDLGRHLERLDLPTVYVRTNTAIITHNITFLVFGPDGGLLFKDAEFKLEPGNALFHEFVVQALARHYPLALTTIEDRICIVTAAPVLDSCARVHGALVLVRVLDRIFLDQTKELVQADLILSTGPGKCMTSTVLENARPDWQSHLETLIYSPDRVRNSPEKRDRIISIAGDQYFFWASTFNNLERKPVGTIIIALSMGPFQQAFRQTISILAVCVLIALMIMVLVIFRLSRQTTGPLLKLAALTGQMGQGHPVSFETVRTGDEIEILARSFERLQTDLEESVRKMMLNRNLATLGRFATDIVHEIKNPLEGLKLLVNGLRRRVGSDQSVSAYIEEIDQAIHKLDSLIRQTLDFARITKPEQEDIELNPFLAELIAQSRFRSNIVLTLPQSSPVLHADREQLARVVTNILTNAGEAISAQGTITVAVRNAAHATAIVISDDGPGIVPELHQKIFDPFFTTKPNGHGLGLSIAYQLATNNELDLVFQPLDPTGSQFIIRPKYNS
ncbi:HAMP domain-containing protein [bacterium]|nr:HAMP domain-containing protein [bacterium]